jgi:hypothetical protein
MSTQYSRSPKVQLGGILILGESSTRFDTVMPARSKTITILTVGFDRPLLDFLELDTSRDV